MAAPAPLPVPLNPLTQTANDNVPIAPPLSPKLANMGTSSRYFINTKQVSHGKQWIARCLEKRDLVEINSGFLPDKRCIFYWIQREYAYKPHELFGINDVALVSKPCISFIPSQSELSEKSKFAKLLYKYYGNDAWKITPMTFDCDWNENISEWILSTDLMDMIKSASPNTIWITKSNFGSLGKGIRLFVGNKPKLLNIFLNKSYKPTNWGIQFEKRGYTNFEQCLFKNVIVQQYIRKPLLYNNYYKFDLRVYTLIASTNPCILFYHIGKMRVCAVKYNDLSDKKENDDIHQDDLYCHLSNCKIQRSHIDYDHTSSSVHGNTMLCTWNDFIAFMYEMSIKQKRFPVNWFEKYQYNINSMTLDDMKDLIDHKCRELMSYLYSAGKTLLDQDSIKYNRPCQFIMHGGDIIIDEKGKFYILEVNRCPSISLIGHNEIKEMTKVMLKEIIDITLEIRDLKMKGKHVDQDTPLKSVKTWMKCKLDYKKSPLQKIDDLITGLDTFL